MNYFITAKEEVLREVAASVNAKIINYMIENHIETDHKNAISVMLDQVYALSESLIEKDNTMEDLEKVSAKLAFARDYIEKMVQTNG
ncbi:MAG: hypothetical protein IKN85_10565 [Oscillospiraceae bacterium]|nr:hypothetical protein [Oscillospiraceae bacterium]MBR6837137.1 hypothetical protein [Oscillospiraceae bacterium]MBR6922984.1 hypothetical protein [Oscillospiraceae bacterium]